MTRDTKKPINTDLTDAEMKQLQKFADQHGMTAEGAASHMAQQELRARYTKPKINGRVISFKGAR